MQRVTVTFEFNSAEEAVLFLGKQIDDTSAVTVVAPKTTLAQPPAAEGPKRGRGRPKKADKQGAAGEGSSSSPVQEPAAPVSEAKPAVEAGGASGKAGAGDAASAESTDRATPPSTSSAVAAAAPSKEDLVAAMQGVLDNKSVDAVMNILAKYGVESAGQLPVDKRVEFIAYCGKVARGEVEASK